jgi:hypothetical protein
LRVAVRWHSVMDGYPGRTGKHPVDRESAWCQRRDHGTVEVCNLSGRQCPPASEVERGHAAA